MTFSETLHPKVQNIRAVIDCIVLHEAYGKKVPHGLLYQEGFLDELGSKSAYRYGISLFKLVGGGMRFYHGNCQIAPSCIWREAFECTPEIHSPYTWVDSSGKPVLRFERITSPTREAMHEKYYRQPVLFRWICNSDWLQEILNEKGLRIRYVSTIEKLP